MITLQSLMLIALGFLLASLVCIALSTAYRNRIVRLTTDAIRRSVPITEAEIRADKDRLRAQYAIRVHKLESLGEQQRLSSARQRIEMNRRDARIAELETELESLRASLEENVNARRVLEHTVTDRLPVLEQQLDNARGSIKERDDEMTSLKTETTRSVRALDEAMQINAQQRAEVERMKTTLSRRAGPDRDSISPARFDGDSGLRGELEALRTKTREQNQLIARLQGASNSGAAPAFSAAAPSATADAPANAEQPDNAEAEARLGALNLRIDEQSAELARLRGALSAYENSDDASQPTTGRDKPIAGQTRINSLQAQLTVQNETIQKLRAELVAGNERLARQAAHFMDEMRHLGAGTVATSVEPRRAQRAPANRSLTERIGQSSAAPATAANARGSAQRHDKPLSRRLVSGVGRGPTSAKVAEYIRALSDDAPVAAAATADDVVDEVAISTEGTAALGNKVAGTDPTGANVMSKEPHSPSSPARGTDALQAERSATFGDDDSTAGPATPSSQQQSEHVAIAAVTRAASENRVRAEPEAGSAASAGSKPKLKLLDRISGLSKS